jgi:hypothetical protein
MDKRKIIIGLLFLVLIIIIIGVIILFINNKPLTSSKIKYITLGEEYELEKAEKLYIKDDARTTIKFITSVDSRCKEGQECIWQGEIEYTLIYKTKDKESRFFLGEVTKKEYKIDNYIISLVSGSENKIIIKVEEFEQKKS